MDHLCSTRNTFALISSTPYSPLHRYGPNRYLKIFSSRSEFLGPSSSESFNSGKSIPKPSKLNRLKYAGFSAEFLDRVEPNGNILDKDAPGKRVYPAE